MSKRYLTVLLISLFISHSSSAHLCLDVSEQRPITFKTLNTTYKSNQYSGLYSDVVVLKADLLKDESIDVFPTNKERPAPVEIDILTQSTFKNQPRYEIGKTYTLFVSTNGEGHYSTYYCEPKNRS